MRVLEMRSVSKTFPGTLAVDNVDFDVREGEVHALLGENGAGKSTLMKILAGSYRDYTGEIRLRGKPVRLDSPAAALNNGVGMIYQELSLAEPISICENIFIGRLPVKGFRIDRKGLMNKASEALSRVGLNIDPSLTVQELSRHEAQLVEIARALETNPSILVMDEPTSSLSRDEIRNLFSLIEQLKKKGLAIIYITHRLPEIFRIADRITILRDGRHITTLPVHETTSSSLAGIMVGRDLEENTRVPPRHGEPPTVLEVDDLSRNGFFHHISFSVQEGEILGIAGLAGAGRSELGRSLCGIDPADTGKISVRGREIKKITYRKSIKQGMIYLSEDRKNDGLFPGIKVGDNILAAVINKGCRAGFYSQKKQENTLNALMNTLNITPPRPQADVCTLSGGNQQKVFLAKWLAARPGILILDEPTRGVDVGARSRIHGTILNLAKEGKTVILISSDLTEMVSLCSRILVMRQGRITEELEEGQLTEETIILSANGEGIC